MSTPVLFHISNADLTLFLSESHTSSYLTSSNLPLTSMHCLHFTYSPSCFSMYISIDARVLTTLSTMPLAPHFSLASLFLLFLVQLVPLHHNPFFSTFIVSGSLFHNSATHCTFLL